MSRDRVQSPHVHSLGVRPCYGFISREPPVGLFGFLLRALSPTPAQLFRNAVTLHLPQPRLYHEPFLSGCRFQRSEAARLRRRRSFPERSGPHQPGVSPDPQG
eukprot:251847_1